MTKFTRPFYLLAALMLLPACTSWQLGECLRAPYATYTGLDLDRPADGKVYHAPTRGLLLPETCYLLAPEKTYQLDPPLFYESSGLQSMPKDEASELRPTGRVVPVRLRLDAKGEAYVYDRSLTALPKGLVADDAESSPLLASAREQARQAGNRQYALPAENGGSPQPQRTQPGLARRFLIGCCDYVADPLLTVVSTPVEWALLIVGIPFSAVDAMLGDD